MNSLYLIIALFALGAIIGMYLLSLALQKKHTPKLAALFHGVFVAAALVLLIIYSSEHPGLLETLVIFVIAALGGAVLIMRDLSRKPLPKSLAIGHGLVSVAGFIFLLATAFSK